MGMHMGWAVFVRMFPFARGLFEDKVSNFWCVLNTVVKIRTIADNTTLARIRYTRCNYWKELTARSKSDNRGRKCVVE